MHHQGLDHLALVVRPTDEALAVWRDRLGFPVVSSEIMYSGAVRLTQLDRGNTHLQLVDPLTPDHPLQAGPAQHGPGLHSFGFKLDSVAAAQAERVAAGPASATPPPHPGAQAQRPLFRSKSATQNVQLEVTSA